LNNLFIIRTAAPDVTFEILQKLPSKIIIKRTSISYMYWLGSIQVNKMVILVLFSVRRKLWT